MYIELLPICGNYRGASRNLRLDNIKLPRRVSRSFWKRFFPLFEKYMDWEASMDDTFTPEVRSLLLELKQEILSAGGMCELIVYSDDAFKKEFNMAFLGYDVFGDYVQSAIQEGNKIPVIFAQKLNENGLFSERRDAENFCEMWKTEILAGTSPWEIDVNPRPFEIWECLDP